MLGQVARQILGAEREAQLPVAVQVLLAVPAAPASSSFGINCN
jgi:hypothetical protein